ncbi:MAG: hypothetical protein RDA78_20270 [Roseibium sp.]|uniref:hypothetical protein n=1 Tax=Roseibium sp. TaxID=1936156 RepID=UPI003D9C5D6B
MTRLATVLLALTLSVAASLARADFAEGSFSMVNTAAFSEENGQRTPLQLELESAEVTIAFQPDDRLSLTVGATEITLHPVSSGLDGLRWDPQGIGLLHENDVKALNQPLKSAKVPAWGSDLVWPGLGVARLVLLPLGSDAYAGFLISHPEDRTVVRQMEFRKVPGPRDRPG